MLARRWIFRWIQNRLQHCFQLLGPDLQTRLMGQTLQITLEQTPFTVCIHIDRERRVKVSAHHESPTVTLSGTVNAFRAFLNKPEAAAGGVRIEGDFGTLYAFAELFRASKEALEEILSPWVGPAVSHHIGKALRIFSRFCKRQIRDTKVFTGEWLQYDGNAVPTRHEFTAFTKDVHKIAEKMDALEGMFP